MARLQAEQTDIRHPVIGGAGGTADGRCDRQDVIAARIERGRQRFRQHPLLITDEYLHSSPPTYSNASALSAICRAERKHESPVRRYAEFCRREFPGLGTRRLARKANRGGSPRPALFVSPNGRRHGCPRVRRAIRSEVAREVANSCRQGHAASAHRRPLSRTLPQCSPTRGATGAVRPGQGPFGGSPVEQATIYSRLSRTDGLECARGTAIETTGLV